MRKDECFRFVPVASLVCRNSSTLCNEAPSRHGHRSMYTEGWCGCEHLTATATPSLLVAFCEAGQRQRATVRRTSPGIAAREPTVFRIITSPTYPSAARTEHWSNCPSRESEDLKQRTCPVVSGEKGPADSPQACLLHLRCWNCWSCTASVSERLRWPQGSPLEEQSAAQ